MRKLIVVLVVVLLAVSACTVQGTTPTSAPAPAQPTTQPAAASSAASNPTPAPAAAGATVYKIVPGQSTASYEVGEVFFNENNRFNLAKGTTPQVSGDITIDTANPANSQVSVITIDVSQLQSDSSRRDGFVRDRALQANQYPQVTFTPTSIDGLPSSYTPGQDLTFKVTGNLQVKDTTKPVTFDVTAKLDGNTLTGSATAGILLSDFGAGPINLAGMLKTEDQAKLTINFVAQP
jgi:polyisoprenoid-binding protein YceI